MCQSYDEKELLSLCDSLIRIAPGSAPCIVAAALKQRLEQPMSERERKLADAIIAMAEDGWLLHSEEGMTDAQKKCLEAYILAKKEKGNEK